MSVRILHDQENGMAVLYHSAVDVAFGPVFYEQGNAGYSALQYAEKFVEWAQLNDARLWITKPDQEVMDKYYDFQRLEWKECPECYDALCPGAEEACDKCLHECRECGDEGVDTVKLTQGKESSRYCGDCARAKFGNYPGMPAPSGRAA